MFNVYGHHYFIDGCEQRVNNVTELFIYQFPEPIFHPAVCGRLGDNYGIVMGWSKTDVETQLLKPRVAMQIPANLVAADLYRNDKNKFYRVTQKIINTHACAVCARVELDRFKLFACSDGDVMHKKCALKCEGKCPVCKCEIL